MRIMTAAIRAFAALALVLALVVGAFNVRSAGAQSGTPVPPVPTNGTNYTIASDAITLYARQEATTEFPGYTYIEQTSGTTSAAVPEGASSPLVGAQFTVEIAGTNEVIDTVITDANGMAKLDAPLDVPFVIRDSTTQTPSNEITLTAEDVAAGPIVFTADRGVSPDQMNEPTGPAGTTYPVAADALKVVALEVQDPNQGGTTTFSDAATTSQAVGDSQPAVGRAFEVLDPDGNIVDTGVTGADGTVLLNIPVDVPFTVVDVVDGSSSAPITLSAADVASGLHVLTASVFVDSVSYTNPEGVALTYPVAQCYLSLYARTQIDPTQAGTTYYSDITTDGTIAPAAVGDSAPAPGVTFSVYDTNGTLVDTQTTDANGFACLTVPADGTTGFTITNSVDNTTSQVYDPITQAQVQNQRSSVTATIFQAGPASASPSPSPSTNGTPSAIATATPSASATATPTIPVYTGAVVEGGATVTGIFREDCSLAGSYEYYYNLTAAAETGDLRLAGAGEMTFQVLTEINGVVYLVDQQPTDANGMATLNIPANDPYFIAEINDVAANYGSDTMPPGNEATASFVVFEYTCTASGSGTPVATTTATSAPAASGTTGGTTGGNTESGHGHHARPGQAAGGTTTTTTTTSLPNTGAGSTDSGSAMTWALFALLAVAGVAAASLGLRRRNA